MLVIPEIQISSKQVNGYIRAHIKSKLEGIVFCFALGQNVAVGRLPYPPRSKIEVEREGQIQDWPK